MKRKIVCAQGTRRIFSPVRCIFFWTTDNEHDGKNLSVRSLHVPVSTASPRPNEHVARGVPCSTGRRKIMLACHTLGANPKQHQFTTAAIFQANSVFQANSWGSVEHFVDSQNCLFFSLEENLRAFKESLPIEKHYRSKQQFRQQHLFFSALATQSASEAKAFNCSTLSWCCRISERDLRDVDLICPSWVFSVETSDSGVNLSAVADSICTIWLQ